VNASGVSSVRNGSRQGDCINMTLDVLNRRLTALEVDLDVHDSHHAIERSRHVAHACATRHPRHPQRGRLNHGMLLRSAV
jgi:hypothetical protein